MLPSDRMKTRKLFRTDRLGNRIKIEIANDEFGTVGFIRGGALERIAGFWVRPVVLSVAGESGEDAADRAISLWNSRRKVG
jgi:hypothetical protein